jgi:hypothetical protein
MPLLDRSKTEDGRTRTAGRNSAWKRNRKSDGSSQCNSCVVERDRNVCLEFSPIKFDDEFDDPRHKSRVDGAAAVHKETRAWAIL